MKDTTTPPVEMSPADRFEALAQVLAEWFVQNHGSKESEHSTGLPAAMKRSCSNQRDFNGLPREGERQ